MILKILPSAVEDLREGWRFYEEQQEGLGDYFQDKLRSIPSPHVREVRGKGLLVGMELVRDRVSKEHASEETLLFMDKCKDKGVLVGKGGLFGNVVRVAPPLSINAAQVDELLDVFDRSLAEIPVGNN